MIRILTPRLILRPLSKHDGPAIASATDETWDDLSKWMRWATDRAALTDSGKCAAYAQACYDRFIAGQDFTFGGFLKDEGDLALISRLSFQQNSKKSYEFCGYWCRKKYQNQGYMSEAVNVLSRYAFNTLKTPDIRITHAAGNNKTRAIMNKMGFIEESILPQQHRLPDGSLVDEHILRLETPASLPILEITVEKT